MFTSVPELLKAATPQLACQRLRAASSAANDTSGSALRPASSANSSSSSAPTAAPAYAHPMDGSCPLTGAVGSGGCRGQPVQAASCRHLTAAAALPTSLLHVKLRAVGPGGLVACPRARRRPLCLPVTQTPSPVPQPTSPPTRPPLAARKFPAYTALRVRQLFLSSCPAGMQVQSKAAQTFAMQRDPEVVLLRGTACTAAVQRMTLQQPGGRRKRRRRQRRRRRRAR